MSATFDGLREIIAHDYRLPLERLTPETNLADLEIDSLGVIELIFSLEDRFEVKASDARRDFATLGEVAIYIDRLIAERDARPCTVPPPQ